MMFPKTLDRKILVAPDTFKGSLTAKLFCDVVSRAVVDHFEGYQIEKMPMADGGEGTVDALVLNTKGRYVLCQVEDPLGRLITAQYGILGDGNTAVIEMASASGLPLLKKDELNPMVTSSYGTGQMIKDAIKNGCSKIIFGIGGSATNEGGMGMLSALGIQFLDNDGHLLKGCGQDLIRINTIDLSGMDRRLQQVEIQVACDVQNTLLGSSGATAVYGTQKGATTKMKEQLEAGMNNYASQLAALAKCDVSVIPGSGAAGGLGAGLLGLLNAKLHSGFDLISSVVNLENRIEREGYHLIITGEGQMNHQTSCGKLPQGIAQLGKKYGIPVIGIVGSLGEGYKALFNDGMTTVFSIVNGPMTLEAAMKEGEVLLYDLIVRIIRLIEMK